MKTEATTVKQQSEEKIGKYFENNRILFPHSRINMNPNHLVTANTSAAVDQILSQATHSKLTRTNPHKKWEE